MPKISICIPVYNAESTLLKALDSVYRQGFTDWEIIVVNDGSPGRDENGFKCEKIVGKFIKENKLSKSQIKYIEHRKNLGLLEARRTAVENASGKYISILDSDDELLPDALLNLFNTAEQSNSDIVQGKTELVFTDKFPLKNRQQIINKMNNLFTGSLEDFQIFDGYMIKGNHHGILWGKLFDRELYLKALDQIPFTNCVMAEDVLQYFFISLFAKKYTGIDIPVYKYTVGSGISNQLKIYTIEKWEQYCSTANVFTILFSSFESMQLTQEQVAAVKKLSRSYVVSYIKMLDSVVVLEIREEARKLLCDYWGKDFVLQMEEALKNSR